MNDGEDEELRRVRFFSPQDLSAGLYVERVVELVEGFDEKIPLSSAVEAIEMYNVVQFLRHDMVPSRYRA